jgi:hypothetical protein
MSSVTCLEQTGVGAHLHLLGCLGGSEASSFNKCAPGMLQVVVGAACTVYQKPCLSALLYSTVVVRGYHC